MRHRLVTRWFLLALVPLAIGCPRNEKQAVEPARETPRAAALKLLVVDDPEMAAAIRGLAAEWQAQTGGTLTVSECTSQELLAGNAMPGAADAAIYPAAELGALATREWIVPLPAEFSSNRELAWRDTFDLEQLVETRWGETPYAVPFGSPVLTCYYRPDLLARLHKQPPQSWAEYRELAELLGKRESLGDAAPAADAAWHGAAEPLAEGWAAGSFLTRAAAYAKHRDHYSTLFDIESMEPLIAGPAFVRALEELVDDLKLAPQNALELDPAAVRREFLAGHLALALTWPGHASAEKPAADPPPTSFTEAPGARDVYNIALGDWEKRPDDESTRVPLLGLAGRVGSVTRSTSDPAAALQLLAWLSGRQWSPTVSAASAATTLYRRSQIKAPQPWLDRATGTVAAAQYATTVYDALGHAAYLTVPRIPGHAEYMQALDAAVRAAATGEKKPADALTAAAGAWRAITARHGADAQRKAYRLSLALEP